MIHLQQLEQVIGQTDMKVKKVIKILVILNRILPKNANVTWVQCLTGNALKINFHGVLGSISCDVAKVDRFEFFYFFHIHPQKKMKSLALAVEFSYVGVSGLFCPSPNFSDLFQCPSPTHYPQTKLCPQQLKCQEVGVRILGDFVQDLILFCCLNFHFLDLYEGILDQNISHFTLQH